MKKRHWQAVVDSPARHRSYFCTTFGTAQLSSSFLRRALILNRSMEFQEGMKYNPDDLFREEEEEEEEEKEISFKVGTKCIVYRDGRAFEQSALFEFQDSRLNFNFFFEPRSLFTSCLRSHFLDPLCIT